MERGRPRREYSREMRGDPVPQNFTDGVRPRWDERLVEVPNADGVAERSYVGRDAEEKRREEPWQMRRRRGVWGASTGERAGELRPASARGRSSWLPPRGQARSRDPARRRRG